MLNCLPETIVWGEHNGFLTALLTSYDQMEKVAGGRFAKDAARHLEQVIERRPVLSDGSMSVEWLNPFKPIDIAPLYRDFLDSVFLPERYRDRFRRWGFKEIRYRRTEFDRLRRLYPGFKPIFLFRHPVAVLDSQFRGFVNRDRVRFAPLMDLVAAIYAFGAELPEWPSSRCHFVDYDDLVSSFDSVAAQLFDFLEETPDSTSLSEIEREVRKKRSGHQRPILSIEDWAAMNKIVLSSDYARNLEQSYGQLLARKA